jgi:hypothetical protein
MRDLESWRSRPRLARLETIFLPLRPYASREVMSRESENDPGSGIANDHRSGEQRIFLCIVEIAWA